MKSVLFPYIVNIIMLRFGSIISRLSLYAGRGFLVGRGGGGEVSICLLHPIAISYSHTLCMSFMLYMPHDTLEHLVENLGLDLGLVG